VKSTDKIIIDAYLVLWEGLNFDSRKELVDKLTESLVTAKEKRKKALLDSFGAWASDESPE
jgi:hypothetical protein